MHLSPEFGLTYKEIEKDGFVINKKIEMLLSSDSPIGITKSMGLALISLSEAYNDLSPDIIVILGDRFEAMAAASAACISRIPIAHIHGGETTEGAFDEAFRHSITKMSHIHLTATEAYRRRVIQLGESPDRVFNVGAMGVENVKKMKLLPKKELETRLNFNLSNKSIMVTFHPVTLEQTAAREQFQNLLDALHDFNDIQIIFTKANADTEGRIINQMIDDYTLHHKHNTTSFVSMGQLLYLSAVMNVDAVVGNSSSGIIEAPSLNTPTVNIGDRQKGRIRTKSVLDCEPLKGPIIKTLQRALSPEFSNHLAHVSNPYEKENTTIQIKEILKSFNLDNIIKKEFYDQPIQ